MDLTGRPADSSTELERAPVRNRAWYKLNGLARTALARNFGLLPGQYLVNEFPKSGGTWLAQMLSAYTGVPYPRLRLPLIGRNVLHSHYRQSFGTSRVVVVWRDPRDVLVSHFYHCVYERAETSSANTSYVRNRMGLGPSDEVVFDRHFPRFHELVVSRCIHPYFTWSDFFDEWFDCTEVHHTSYERLYADTAAELSRAAAYFGLEALAGVSPEAVVDRFDFRRLSGRSKGEADNRAYMRKGVVGDWKNVMDDATGRHIETGLGGRLARYEARLTTPAAAPLAAAVR